jgi:short-subunit dehydrogenase
LAVYAATKAYVTNLTESLHEEVRGSGVKVTALCPGLTRTEFQSVSNTSEYQAQFPEFLWCTSEDVARVGLEDVVKGKALSVPGALYKGLVGASSVLPGSVKRFASRLTLKAR